VPDVPGATLFREKKNENTLVPSLSVSPLKAEEREDKLKEKRLKGWLG
jgi:hypothetical protein